MTHTEKGNKRKRRVESIFDLEGPLLKNDFGHDIVTALARDHGFDGGSLFRNMGEYNLARCLLVDGVEPGDTLGLIAPFIKAMGADLGWMGEFARENNRPMNDVLQLFPGFCSNFNTSIISTTYEPCIVAANLGIKPGKIVGTKLRGFDRVTFSPRESQRIIRLAEEISTLPPILYDNSGPLEASRATYIEMSAIMDSLGCMVGPAKILQNIKVINRATKLSAMQSICKRNKIPVEDSLVFGDSITDQYILQAAGLSVAVNGAPQIIKYADIAYIGMRPVEAAWRLVNIFSEGGIELAKRRCSSTLNTGDGFLATVTRSNIGKLMIESSKKRKTARSEAIGSLP